MRKISTLSRMTIATFAFVISLVMLPQLAAAKPVKRDGGLYQLYNARYCEIFVVQQVSPTISLDIFNTIGLNNCPPDQFAAIDLPSVAAAQGGLVAQRNGPRRWVLDAITSGETGDPVDIGGLEMRYVAELVPPSLSPPPFTDITVKRTTVWQYRKGRSLRIVISPEGQRYVMQAFSRAPGSTVHEADLNTLGSNPAIALPEGWTFKTKVVKRKLLNLRASGTAHIVRDGLGSVYQRFTWPKPAKR